MNTKHNQRYQETEERIISVFIELLGKKDLDKITVSEICSLSSVNRTTFYLHFLDVYDLMDQIERRMQSYFGKLFTAPGELTFGERFQKLFAFIGEHRYFYRAYLNTSREPSLIRASLPETARGALERVQQEMGYLSEDEAGYHQAFFSAGLTALIRRWLNTDCRETPEELAHILEREYSPKRELFSW